MAATSDVLIPYKPTSYPQLGDERTFLTREFGKLQDSIRLIRQVIQKLDTTKTPLVSAANDAAAAAAGVPLNGLYHTTGVVHMRLV